MQLLKIDADGDKNKQSTIILYKLKKFWQKKSFMVTESEAYS